MNYLVTPAESLHYGSLVLDLIDKGVLKVNVYKEYKFLAEGVRAAHTDLVSGETTGKLVIKD
jgi:NADPH:quinone reductase